MAKRIMVVDDSRMIYALLKNLLEGTDYEVAAYCRDGEEAVTQYGQVMPDLVTMDIIMSGMDGLETTQAILKEHPEAKIVMLSSLAYDETFDESKAIGAKAFIDKPLERDILLEVFQEVLGEG